MLAFLQGLLGSLFGGTAVATPAPQVWQPREVVVKEVQANPKGASLTQRQVELLAQKVVRNHFPNVDWKMLVTMAAIESNFNPSAYRFEGHINDTSYGLMQVLVGTAQWIYTDLKARTYGIPSAVTLRDPETSLYFGAAYVNYLRRYKNTARSAEWIVRAYNGGPGWANGTRGRTMTLNHWNKYKLKRSQLYG